MSAGCKHGHEANSCTSCYAERRIERLTAERDALQAEVEQVADSFDKLSEIEFATRTENERLRVDLQEARDLIPPDAGTSDVSVYGKLREARERLEACRQDNLANSNGRLEALAENERLRALLADDALARLHKAKVAQLRDLREAVMAHARNVMGYDSEPEAFAKFLAEELPATHPANLTPFGKVLELLAKGGA